MSQFFEIVIANFGFRVNTLSDLKQITHLQNAGIQFFEMLNNHRLFCY